MGLMRFETKQEVFVEVKKGRKSLGLSHSFSIQVTMGQLEWLDAQRGPGETRSLVVRRIINENMQTAKRGSRGEETK